MQQIQNQFAIQGNKVKKTLSKINPKGVKISPLIKILDGLHLSEEYELDVYPEGSGLGYEWHPYIRKKNAIETYEPSKRTKGLRAFFSSKKAVKYDPSFLIRRILSWEEKESIPSIFKYITVDFNEKSLWNAYLLNEIHTMLSPFGYGVYTYYDYIFSQETVDKVKQEYGYDLPFRYPSVCLYNAKSASIVLDYWSNWQGFCRKHILAYISDDGILKFDQSRVDILIPYDCGIRY